MVSVEIPTKNVLTIASIDLQRSLRGAERFRHACVLARLIRVPAGANVRWAAGRWATREQLPRGSDLPRSGARLIVLPAYRVAPLLPNQSWHVLLQPLASQTLFLLLLGTGANREGWQCRMWQAGAERPVDEVRIIGGPILTPDNDRPHMPKVSHDDSDDRWSRLRHAFGSDAFQRLQDLHVLLVGASRNGSTTARQLAAIGLKRLSLVDPDKLEPHNLDAMLGGNASHIGQPKVTVLAEELIRFRPDMAVSCLPWTVTDQRVLKRARSADVLMTCVDHGTPVLLAAELANRWNQIHIDVGTNVQHRAEGGLELTGDVRCFLPHEACASCVGGIADRDQADIDMQLPAGVRTLRPQVDFRTQRAGSLVTLNSVAVSVAVQYLLESTMGELGRSRWTRIDRATGGHWRFEEEAVSGSEDCTICGRWA